MVADLGLKQLRLMHLADSALPIGGTAHSFGLETLVALDVLRVEQLAPLLQGYIVEAGCLEAISCRVAYRLPGHILSDEDTFVAAWRDLNQRLSALKLARESRAASAMLGRRFLQLVLAMEGGHLSVVQWAVQWAAATQGDIHHSAAFGLVGGAFGLGEVATVLAYLQQMVTGLVSACQRLMPLGQSQASRMLWELKPALLATAARSEGCDLEDSAAMSFTPLVEVGSMRHPVVHTRLFMS